MESKSNRWIVLAGVLFLITFTAGCSTQKQNRVCFEDNCFTVELAETPNEQARGLMFREHLDPNGGMLFVFEEEGIHPFWMKNTLIPLDIIWINENKEVVFISKNTPPCKADPCPMVNPERKARYVLEVNGGVSDEIDLKVGDKTKFEIR